MFAHRSRPHRRPVIGLIAAALTLSACGVDSGVVSISASRTQPSGDSSGPPADDTTGAAETVPDESIPDSVPDTVPDAVPDSVPDVLETAESPADTLPPIVEPELYTVIPFTEVVDVDDNYAPGPHDDFVAVAFTDIEDWWAEVFPEVYGEPFEKLSGGLYAGYPSRASAIPGCDEPSTSYPDLQAYVAFYCEFGDFMAYDDGQDGLLLPLADQYGSAVMGVVLAHEYGHAIQARIGALERQLATIVTEQQSDCFAGAWTGHAYRGESDLLRLGDRDVRAGLLAMLSVRDPVGTNQFVPGGHGSAFDRVGAFQEGFLKGPARCAELLDNPLDLMPNQFQRGTADAFFEGNAPYDCSTLDPNVVGQAFIDACTDAPEFLADDLNDFWSTALGDTFAPVHADAISDLSTFDCPGKVALTEQVVICPASRTVAYDEPAVLDLYDLGDFTLGYLYGIGWGEYVQRQLDSPLVGEPRALLNDCFTGAWVRDITPDNAGNTPRSGDRDGDGIDDTVQSSPGDLDEAIQMATLVGDAGANVNVLGSPFEKIAAFRTGVLGGLDACNAMLPG